MSNRDSESSRDCLGAVGRTKEVGIPRTTRSGKVAVRFCLQGEVDNKRTGRWAIHRVHPSEPSGSGCHPQWTTVAVVHVAKMPKSIIRCCLRRSTLRFRLGYCERFPAASDAYGSPRFLCGKPNRQLGNWLYYALHCMANRTTSQGLASKCNA